LWELVSAASFISNIQRFRKAARNGSADACIDHPATHRNPPRLVDHIREKAIEAGWGTPKSRGKPFVYELAELPEFLIRKSVISNGRARLHREEKTGTIPIEHAMARGSALCRPGSGRVGLGSGWPPATVLAFPWPA